MNKQQITKHENFALNSDYIVMCIPLLLMGFFYYGPRVFLLALVAMLTAYLADRFSSMLRGRRFDKTENSSIALALIIVLMLPASVPVGVVVAAVLVAILVGKEAFGGAGCYPFNPAAVGFCAAAVSWPNEVFSYPNPINWMLQVNTSFDGLMHMWSFEGAVLTQGSTAVLRAGGMPTTDLWNLILGNYAGPLGASSTLVIAACALFLIVRKRIPIDAPMAFGVVSILIFFFFPRYTDISFASFPGDIMRRLQVVKFESLCTSLLFSAVFLVPEPGTLPKNRLSRIIYGALLGFGATMFQYYGTYALGTCFAFLIVNATSGYFDRAIAKGSAKRRGAAAL